MSAIEQSILPVPVRPDPSPAWASSGRSSTDSASGQSFSDVYNQQNRGGQSSDDDNHASTAQTSSPAASSTHSSPGSANAGGKPASSNGTGTDGTNADSATGAQTKTSTISNPIVKLTLAQKAAKAASSATDTTASKQDTDIDAKMLEKLARAVASQQSQTDDVSAATTLTTAADADGVAAALKLLGAQAATKGSTRAASTDTTDTAKTDSKKSNESKDKTADADAKGAGELDALNLLSGGVQVQSAASNQNTKDQSGGDTVYRFSRADGTGKSLDMSLPSADANGSKDTATSGIEHITVLDARRFISDGDSVSANTKALVSGMSGDKDWAAAMKAASSANASNSVDSNRVAAPVNTLKIQMTPADMGTVTATLRLQGDQLTVHLSVDSAEAYKHLTQDKDGLVQSLKSQGFSVDQVNIQLNTTSTADRTVAQTSSSQQSGGQQMQDGSAGQFAQQGQGQDNSRRQQSNGFNSNTQFTDQAAGSDIGTDSGTDGARSGQVYL